MSWHFKAAAQHTGWSRSRSSTCGWPTRLCWARPGPHWAAPGVMPAARSSKRPAEPSAAASRSPGPTAESHMERTQCPGLTAARQASGEHAHSSWEKGEEKKGKGERKAFRDFYSSHFYSSKGWRLWNQHNTVSNYKRQCLFNPKQSLCALRGQYLLVPN